MKPFLLLAALSLTLAGCGGPAEETVSKSGTTTTSGTTGSTPSPNNTSADGTITLALQPTVGTTYEFEQVKTQNGQSQTNEMTTKVVSAGGGNVTLESTVKGAEMPGGTLKMVIVVNGQYQVQSVKIDSPDPNAQKASKAIEGAMKMMPVFPGKPVKVGDSWNGSFDLGQILRESGEDLQFKGDTVLDVKMTYTGNRDIEGRQAAVIKQEASDTITMVTPGGDVAMTMTIASDNFFELATGMNLGSRTETKSAFAGRELVQVSETKLKAVQ